MSADPLNPNNGPRKTHRKSKSGCRTCKQRKIKCDEATPVCNNCTRRYGEEDASLCDYGHGRRTTSSSAISSASSCFTKARPPHLRTQSDGDILDPLETLTRDIIDIDMLDDQVMLSLQTNDLDEPPKLSNSTSSEEFLAPDDFPWHGTTDLSFSVPHLDTPIRLRSLISTELHSHARSELDLFQHFMSCTHKTMPLTDVPAVQQLWAVKVPQMALRSNCLLESVAMIAAFHLRSQDPANESLIMQSHHFYGLALRSTRDELGRISPSNAEQLVISSLLLSIASWCFRASSKESYTVPNEALQASSAAIQVYLSTWSWLENMNSSVHGLFSSLDFTGKWKEVHNKRRYSDVVAMLDGLDDPSNDDRDGEELIRHLVAVHSCLYQAESKDATRHRVVQASLNPPQALIQRLQDKDAQALAVWARIVSLWTEIESTWWTADIVEYELNGVQQIFEERGYSEGLLSWPLARLPWDSE